MHAVLHPVDWLRVAWSDSSVLALVQEYSLKCSSHGIMKQEQTGMKVQNIEEDKYSGAQWQL